MESINGSHYKVEKEECMDIFKRKLIKAKGKELEDGKPIGRKGQFAV